MSDMPGVQNSTTSSASDWLSRVEKIAADACEQQACFLYDMDFLGTGQGRTLRVFIDKSEGVGIEDCSNVSKALNEALDTGDLIPGGAYHLEVSTPGVDRVLRKTWHFERVVGKKIRIRTGEALEAVGIVDEKWKKTKTVEEILQAVENESVVFLVKEGTLRIPLSAIEKANVVFELEKPQKNLKKIKGR